VVEFKLGHFFETGFPIGDLSRFRISNSALITDIDQP
jgi:hypothetical protein